MDEKFILMNINDDRSKDIAEALGSKTCKKILEFLSERKEASEREISEGLNMPMNTTEYNLKKLLKCGLVIDSGNFFWSIKGKKIPMYKLARKHIIFSPDKKPSLSSLKTIIPIIIAAAFLVFFLMQFPVDNTGIKKFSSSQDLKDFLKENFEGGSYFRSSVLENTARATGETASTPKVATADSSAFSTTNIQVEGVDEADIVKNDGEYIYLASGTKINIVNADSEDLGLVAEININKSISNIFLNGDKLIAFASDNSYIPYVEAKCLAGIRCGYESRNLAYIYDISDRKNPLLKDALEIEGNYIDSRMIGNYVYVISNKNADIDNPIPPIYSVNGAEKQVQAREVYYIPSFDSNYVFTSISAINIGNGEVNNKVYLTGYTGQIYVSQDNIYLTTIKRISYKEKFAKIIEEVYNEILPQDYQIKVRDLWASSESYPVKMESINEIVEKYSNSLKGKEKENFDKEFMDKLEKFNEKISREEEKTLIYKINIANGDSEFEAGGEVFGNVLNQFSMDEFEGNFRIATTSGEVWTGKSVNNLYILDEGLNVIGKVENLAEGEKIYSARFIGERVYIVTFKQIDPLFVIDASNPENPKVLGYLKITGYSDYLHPYDETHLIGIGKEVIENQNFALYQGLKISLFDVSDVSAPIETAKIEIGDRGTDSEALYNHKAVLFDKDKGILVLPVSLAEITDEQKSAWQYGETRWVGAYVFNIEPDEISVRGRITHFENYIPRYGPAKNDPLGFVRETASGNWVKLKENAWIMKDNYYWERTDEDIDKEEGGINYKNFFYDYNKKIVRSLYIGNVLYTISFSEIKANDIDSVEEISSLKLKTEENPIIYYIR